MKWLSTQNDKIKPEDALEHIYDLYFCMFALTLECGIYHLVPKIFEEAFLQDNTNGMQEWDIL